MKPLNPATDIKSSDVLAAHQRQNLARLAMKLRAMTVGADAVLTHVRNLD